MLQKLSLTLLMLAVVSTPFTARANKSLHPAATQMQTQRNVRKPWQYATLAATDIALIAQVVATTNPAVCLPITCVALVCSGVMIVAPDEVKDALANAGTHTVTALRTMKTKAKKHLETTDTEFLKRLSGWRP